MNLTHLILFNFWTGATETTTAVGEFGYLRFTLVATRELTHVLEKTTGVEFQLGVEV